MLRQRLVQLAQQPGGVDRLAGILLAGRELVEPRLPLFL
jgi:hypothetical protein